MKKRMVEELEGKQYKGLSSFLFSFFIFCNEVYIVTKR